MYRETSGEAYALSYPNHETNRFKVLKVIEFMQSCTDYQISEVLGWKINRVTPRRNELVKAELVEEHMEGIDPLTNTNATYWKIK